MNKQTNRFFKSSLRLFILLIVSVSHAQDWTMKKAPLMTKWANDIDKNHPLSEYPRPQMVRSEWINLNGLWEFATGGKEDAVPAGKTLTAKILVPYPAESALSGVMEHHERLWYRRMFTIPGKMERKANHYAFWSH